MVAEDHPAVRGHEVAPVVDALRRRLPIRIEREELGGQEGAVEAVGDGVDRDGATTNRRRSHLAAPEREHADGDGSISATAIHPRAARIFIRPPLPRNSVRR
jgi:hypothetical protein